MGRPVESIAGLILDAAPAAAVLSILLTLALVGCRQPARRRTLARAGVVGLLLVIPLRAWAPLGGLDLGGPLRRIGELSLAVPSVAGPADDEAAGPEGGWRLGGAARLAYLGGAALGLGWLLLGWYGSAWLSRRASAPSKALVGFYEALPFGGRRRPRLRISARVRGPVLVGLARPTILIPPQLDRPEARDRLRVGLLHELAHAEADDPGFVFLAGLAQAVWFFLPPLWWIRAQMRLDQEYVADRRAAEGLGATAYASSLLDWAGPRGAAPSAAAAAPAVLGAGPSTDAGTPSALVQRMTMLLQCPFAVEPKAPAWWGWAAPAAVGLATLGIAAVDLDAAPEPGAATASAARVPTSTRLFRSARLVLGAAAPGPDGRVRPVQLPVSLPARFRLTFEVQAPADVLAQTRAAGLPLGPRRVPETSDQWHHVRIEREPGRAAVWVDGRAVPPGDAGQEPAPRLAFEPPPHHPLAIRNLILTW